MECQLEERQRKTLIAALWWHKSLGKRETEEEAPVSSGGGQWLTVDTQAAQCAVSLEWIIRNYIRRGDDNGDKINKTAT